MRRTVLLLAGASLLCSCHDKQTETASPAMSAPVGETAESVPAAEASPATKKTSSRMTDDGVPYYSTPEQVPLKLSDHWDASQLPISMQCAQCHAAQFNEWAASDHAWAWRRLRPEDAQAFQGQQLTAHGSTITFHQSGDGKRLLLTDSASGKTYPVDSVLGHIPLIQYLVPAPDGGLHTPSASWDTEKKEWFDMFEDDPRQVADGTATRQAGEWGHWQSRGLNWNSQCAWCHMTGFHKNYDPATDTYSSTWKEPGVTCIQCHKPADHPDPEDGCMIAKADRKLTDKQIHDNCSTCHARREELDDKFQVGDAFDDHFRLELPLVPGIFRPNGMQQEEDYCETGMRLSRMGQTGVTCKDCHDEHTGQLILPQEDNQLCLRCHEHGEVVNGVKAPIGSVDGEPCPEGSGGRVCVNCHMPLMNYMSRDPRRDHSFDFPDPVISEELGIPNACNLCHTDKDVHWAANISRNHYPGKKLKPRRPRTRAVYAAMNGKGNVKDLLEVYRTEDIDAWRATLLELMARTEITPEVLQVARAAMLDKAPIVRAAAARVLGAEALPRLVNDPCKLVRRAVAWPLVERLATIPAYSGVVKELEETAIFQADQPTGAMQLAILAGSRQDYAEAEKQYRRAISMDPASHVAYMDFAVFLARQGRPVDALKQMLAAAKIAPGDAQVQYRLALALAEVGQYQAALVALDKALNIDPAAHAARETKIQLLQFLNRPQEAAREEQILRALRQAPPQS